MASNAPKLVDPAPAQEERRAEVRVRTERVLKGRERLLCAVVASIHLSATLAFLVYWFSILWVAQSALFALVTAILLIVLGNYQGRWLMLLFMRRPVLPPASSRFRVAVATTFVPGAEGADMLEDTVRAMVAIEGPHDTWVLDEGDDPHVRAICKRLGARHFSRKGLGQYQAEDGPFRSGTKYGNINAWLAEHGFGRYDVVSLFDPDHVPYPSFLSRVLGYFEDPSIGYVQAAPAYYNQEASLVARGAAEETYAYNSSIQMAAYAMGYPVIVGSHNTHRVSALEEIGGLAPHDADDLLTTIVYRARGWQGVYVPEILARGLAPVDWSAYVNQQRRWARSGLDVKMRLYPRLSGDLSPTARAMGLLHGLNYLYRSFAIFGALVVLTYVLMTGIGSTSSDHLLSFETLALCVTLFVCDFYRQRFYLDWRNEWGPHWRIAILHLAKWPYMLMALGDAILRRRVSYTITPKAKGAVKGAGTFIPHAIVAVVVAAAWLVGHLFHLGVPLDLQIVAGAFVVAQLAIVVVDRRSAPDPYDRRLSPTRCVESEGTADV